MTVTPLNCDIWLPTIVAVNGVCTGAGLHFIADADLVVASSTASFLDTHVSVGQVAAIEPITLLPRIGLGNGCGSRSGATWPHRSARGTSDRSR